MPWRRVAVAMLAAVLALPESIPAGTRPSVVFLLLDTTRADRLGAWGHDTGVTPALDALARRGIRFTRHFANSHATRPSMPQLMSGRYYRGNILTTFEQDAHPREMSFARPDPSPLLPKILADAGYATMGVSAHTWVAPDSELGRAFGRLELLPFSTADAHGDAVPLVDRALDLWAGRDPSRPTFLYVHFMDAHIPRRLPEGAPLRPVPGYDWRARFRPNGEPAFDRTRRGWSRHDASDFTANDRAHYAAVYDTRLHHMDGQIGRLLARLEADDPGLRSTVVVVTADHGEELGEDGRVEHPASLADGVQHIPWIVAGGPIPPEQRCEGLTEHVDVVPSLLGLLGIPLPEATARDGTAWLDAAGPRRPCGDGAAFYAWEDYRAIRTPHHLLVEHPDGGLEARCHGRARFYRVDRQERRELTDTGSVPRRTRLRRLLEERLGERERDYRAARWTTPTAPLLLRTDFWRLDPEPPIRCVTVNEDVPRSALVEPGWFATGRGLALVDSDTPPLALRVDAPAGTYAVEAATTPIPAAPWLFGISRWRRRAFKPDTPSAWIPLGSHEAAAGELRLELPPDVLAHHHVLGVRLSPPGATTPSPTVVDREQQERLRALGYVQ